MKLRLLFPLVATVASALGATEIWVSPTGQDSAAGTAAAPVATLKRAAELVRSARTAQPTAPITVWLQRGDYPVLDTFAFSAPDSGRADAPVIWRGVDRATTRLLGARAIDRTKLRPLADPALLPRVAPEAQGKILELDLAAHPVRFSAKLPDYVRDEVPLFSLYFNGQRLPLSRWPNGEFGYTTMKRVLSSGNWSANKPDGGTFEYREDRPARWAAAVAENAVWLRGFWRVPWIAETLRVGRIDATAKTITFAISTSQGIGSKYSPLVENTRVGDGKESWFALNLLEEIDQPGEWSVDFTRRKLYLFPPDGFATGELALSDNHRPAVAFNGASFITLRDLTVALQMGDGIAITNGESVQLAGLRVEGVTRRGIVIRGGRNHVVRSCDITEIGLTGIDVLGGDRKTLTPAGHQIVNNHLWRVALGGPVPALTAGLDINRNQIVGVRIAHNRIHDATYGGITFAGNDNVIEHNEIYRVGLDGGDLGGLYTNSGWTSRGNILRRNFIHHSENANAIYIDDGTCGVIILDNLTYRTETGVFIGGGSDNVAHGNILVAAHHAFHVDDRGVARKYVANDPRLRRDLDGVPYQQPPWSTSYPPLAKILETDPSIARNNDLSANFVVGSENITRRSGKPETLVGFVFAHNLEFPLAAFRSPASLDFTRTDPQSGLPAIDLASYGLQVDEFRPKLPARDLELLRTGDTKRKKFDSQQDVNAYPR